MDRKTTYINIFPLATYGPRFRDHLSDLGSAGWTNILVEGDPNDIKRQRLTWERKSGSQEQTEDSDAS